MVIYLALTNQRVRQDAVVQNFAECLGYNAVRLG